MYPAIPSPQVAYVDKMPTVGETVLGDSFGTSFGGKGANQAVMAAKVCVCCCRPMAGVPAYQLHTLLTARMCSLAAM